MMAPLPRAETSRRSSGLGYSAVLVPFDGSDGAEQAARVASELSRKLGTDMHLVTVLLAGDERGAADRRLTSWAHRPDEAKAHVVEGSTVLAAVADLKHRLEPCLVVVGSHGRRRKPGFVGWTTQALIIEFEQPLLLVGPRATFDRLDRGARVLACVDGSPGCFKTVQAAAAWARQFDLQLCVALVVDRSQPVLDRPEAYLADLVRRSLGDDLPVHTQVIQNGSNPDKGILRQLKREPAALVVVPTRVRAGLGHTAVGIEAARIIYAAASPVLVVPSDPDLILDLTTADSRQGHSDG